MLPITPPVFPKVEALAVGVDLLDARRIKPVLERHGERFVRRLLTPHEQHVFLARGKSSNFVAKQWAAKEAIAKALGTGIAQGVSFQHIEVLRDASGAPFVTLTAQAQARLHSLGASKVLLSLSDEGQQVLAFAVLA